MKERPMNYKQTDIVFALREDIDPYELRYVLRSIDKNFPHRKVWFICGQPKGLKPDGAIKHKQTGNSKWALIRSSMWEVLENEEISDPFFWFNDDFFVMKPVKGKFVNFVDGNLEDRMNELHRDLGMTPYCRTLFKVQQELKKLHKPELNFEVHLPMLIDKAGMKLALKNISSPQMRSAYGNYCELETVQHKDMKVYDLESVPEDADYLSTNDETFRNGKVGEFIRQTFDKPSRFEVD